MNDLFVDGLKAILGTILTSILAYIVNLVRARARRVEEYRQLVELLLAHWRLDETIKASPDRQVKYEAMTERYKDIRAWLQGAPFERHKRDPIDISMMVLPVIIFSALLMMGAGSNAEKALSIALSIVMILFAFIPALLLERFVISRIKSNVVGYIVSFLLGTLVLISMMVLASSMTI